MPFDYGTGVSDEALKRALREAMVTGGMQLIGNPNDLGTAVGQAARAGFGAHRDSIERSAGAEAKAAEKQEADEDEIEELNRRIEAVKTLPPELQGEMQNFIQAPNFWEQMGKHGFSEPEDGFTLSEGQQRFDAQGNPIASVSKPGSGFTLSAGQTRYGPDGKPVAAAPAAPGKEDEWEPYSFHGSTLWYQPSPDVQPVPINGPEEMPDPADQVKALTAVADKTYTMAMKQWEAENENAENPLPPPKYRDVYDMVEKEMFGGPAGARPGQSGKANLQAAPPPPEVPPPGPGAEGRINEAGEIVVPPAPERYQRPRPPQVSLASASGAQIAPGPGPAPPPLEATVAEVQARGIPRQVAVAQAAKAFGEEYAAALDEALNNAGIP